MSREPTKQVKVEPLELNKETIADLTEQEAEEVQGGAAGQGRADNSFCCLGTSLAANTVVCAGQ